jgi:hypothetical protein
MKISKQRFGITASFLSGALITVLVGCEYTQVAGTGSNVGTGLTNPTPSNQSPSIQPTVTATPTSMEPTSNPTVMPSATAMPTVNPNPMPTDPALGVSGQIDRVGQPLVSTILLGFNSFSKSYITTEENGRAAQDKYNSRGIDEDVLNFRKQFADTLGRSFGRTDADAASVAASITPDVLTIDTTKPTNFPNGRFLNDDVVDIQLKLFSGNNNATDNINRNDVDFDMTFPYLAKPF